MSENSIMAVAKNGIQTGMAKMAKNAAVLASKEAIEDPSIHIKEIGNYSA